jgi:Zn-dependent peptidase ImmA (M78 family)
VPSYGRHDGGTDCVLYDPWADLTRRPDIVCRSCRLPAGDGLWFRDIRAIALDDRLDRVGRRVALAHELVHVDHDDQQIARIGPDGPRQARRQETRADQEAARRLITLRALGRALAAHPTDLPSVADELDVTVQLLVVRIETLHPSEQGKLRARVDRDGHAA